MSKFVLMAGGTGGHLFPAMALAQELRRRGHEIELMTDYRVGNKGGKFPAREVHVVPSATPSIRNPIKFITAGLQIVAGIGSAFFKLRKIKPDAVIGFGGYPVFPPFVAARMMGLPGLLHEQNAVMGRANRALAGMASAIGLSFAQTKHAEQFANKHTVVGNPVRDAVIEAGASFAYTPPTKDGQIILLVFGGSQGARAFSEFVPPAIAALPERIRKRLRVIQQCRPEDMESVAEQYRVMKANVELAAFFEDLPSLMATSHLVICRSGATSVAELGVLGVPAIMVPLPGALDADQSANARVLEYAGGGWVMEQVTISPQSLATRLEVLFDSPEILAKAGEKAKLSGRPEAVKNLADAAERLVGPAKASLGELSK